MAKILTICGIAILAVGLIFTFAIIFGSFIFTLTSSDILALVCSLGLFILIGLCLTILILKLDKKKENNIEVKNSEGDNHE